MHQSLIHFNRIALKGNAKEEEEMDTPKGAMGNSKVKAITSVLAVSETKYRCTIFCTGSDIREGIWFVGDLFRGTRRRAPLDLVFFAKYLREFPCNGPFPEKTIVYLAYHSGITI